MSFRSLGRAGAPCSGTGLIPLTALCSISSPALSVSLFHVSLQRSDQLKPKTIPDVQCDIVEASEESYDSAAVVANDHMHISRSGRGVGIIVGTSLITDVLIFTGLSLRSVPDSCPVSLRKKETPAAPS